MPAPATHGTGRQRAHCLQRIPLVIAVTEQDGTLVGILTGTDLVELVVDFLRSNEGAAHRIPMASQ
jgi:hypothetical protein